MRKKHPKRVYLACIWFVILMMSVTACSTSSEKEEAAQSAGITQEAAPEVSAEETQPESEQPEDTQAEEAQAEEAQAEEAEAEKAQAEEVQAEEAQPEEAQAEEAQAEETQPEEAQAEEAQAEDAQAEDAQQEEAQPEETPSEEESSEEKEPEEERIDILALNDITYKSMWSKGIQWEWSNEHLLHVWGTSTSKSFTNMYSDPQNLPNGVEPGDELYTELYIDGVNVRMEFLFYLSDGTYSSVVRRDSGPVKVPSNAVGMSIRPYVPESTAAYALMRQFELYKSAK